jgi:adenylate cyclase
VLGFALVSVAGVMYARRVGVGVAVQAGLMLAAVLAAWLLFRQQVFLHLTGPLAAVIAGFSFGSMAKALTEGRQKKQRESFARQYMGAELLEYVIKNPGSLRLGGENREMTVFFNDIAGFTPVSETLGPNNPERLVELLNIYLERMTDVMLNTGAVIDKYMGDAIMSFWGAPMDMQDHAVRACRAALACRTELRRMQPLFQDAVRDIAPQLIKPDGTVL